ncbi:NACHT domain-containing protein [Streptomyces sp. NPDC051985]|uniref:NACHT domain-containing protein n=1 Tax=Streptomyces sp. NPDC051985 TaxID=3155807 RepID=UPI003420BA70
MVFQLVHGRLTGVDVVSIASPPTILALFGLLQALPGDPEEQAKAWADRLASRVMKSEAAQSRRLLGGDVKRINLVYGLVHEARDVESAPAGGSLDASRVLDIVSYYCAVSPRRLVVTGAAGSGKTVLALRLMLGLLKVRQPGDPVPVRFSLSGWDAEKEEFREFAVRQLMLIHQCARQRAETLFDGHRVLPVLDGLDEMDPTLAGSGGFASALAPRACKALEKLNDEQQDDDAAPLILTCRSSHYDALIREGRLRDAARISIAPVSAAQACAYLTARFSDGGVRVQSRWRRVVDELQARPQGPLAQALSTPWRLTLAATAYRNRASDPGELVDLGGPSAVNEHLLARYVNAATRSTRGRGYTAPEVHRWLHRLARGLERQAGSPHTDLVLHELWRTTRWWQVLLTDAVLTGLLACLLLPLCLIVSSPQALFVLIGAGALFCVFGALLSYDVGPPARVAWSNLRSPSKVLRLVAEIALGLVWGALAAVLLGLGIAVLGPAIGIRPGFGSQYVVHRAMVFGLAAGLAFGLVSGIRNAIASEQTSAADPRLAVREDIAFGAAVGLGSGVAGGLVSATTFGVSEGFVYGLCGGLLAGFASAFAAGATGGRVGLRYLAFLLCSVGRLPLRLGLFMDWAYDAGLMRLSGSAYQFRHRELQRWLADHPYPVDGS